MARFLPRLLYQNTVCFSTGALHSLFSSLLPATVHRRNFSSDSNRLRNIWISGLINPMIVPVKARDLFYAGRMKEFHEELPEFYKLTEFYERLREVYERSPDFDKGLVEFDDEFIEFYEGVMDRPRKVLGSCPEGYKNRVQLAFTYTSSKDCKINIMDTLNFFKIGTLNHGDLHIDVQRALHFVDGAILVLCSVRGVQRNSTVVDQHMKGYEIPRLVFIDKLDQKGANPWVVLNQARSKLGHHSAAIQVPIGLEGDFKGFVDLVQLKAYFFQCDNVVAEEIPADMEALVSDKRLELIETVSEVDDKLAEAFRSGKTISSAEIEEAVRRATIARKFIPVLMGSAFKKGPQPLLDGVLRYLPCPIEVSKYALNQTKNGEKLHGSPDKPLVASVVTLKYGLMHDTLTTYLRIYEGVLREGDCIVNVRTGQKKWIHRFEINDDKDIQEVHAGQIINLFNDKNCFTPFCAPGDTFIDGSVRYIKPPINVRENVSKDSEGNEKNISHKNLYIVHQDLMKLLSKHVYGDLEGEELSLISG